MASKFKRACSYGYYTPVLAQTCLAERVRSSVAQLQTSLSSTNHLSVSLFIASNIPYLPFHGKYQSPRRPLIPPLHNGSEYRKPP
jgi:hypothetical protein